MEDGLAVRHQCVPPAENGGAAIELHGGPREDEQVILVTAQIPHAQSTQIEEVLAIAASPGAGRLRLDAWPVADLEFDNDGSSAQHRPAQADKHPVVGHREPLGVEAVVLARNYLRPYEAFKVRVLCQEIPQAPAGAFPGAEH